MNIRPLENRLAIEPIENKRSQSIWTPEEVSRWGNGRRCTRGKVIALGPKATFAKVGDVVQFSDSCLRPFAVDGKQVAIIRDDDVVGVEQ